MHPVLEAIVGHKRIAFVGVAKNCGKTTALHDIQLNSTQAGLPLPGLVSIGIDGEHNDVLLGTPKPKFLVFPDQWLITSEHALAQTRARVEYVASLDYRTVFGETLLVRVITPGELILSGIRHGEDLNQAISLLGRHCPGHIFIDGAYGRTLAARPDFSDGIIVSTSAVLSSSIDEIVDATRTLTKKISLPPVTRASDVSLIQDAITRNETLLCGPEHPPVSLPGRSALIGLRQSRQMFHADIDAIAIPGLVSDRVIEELLRIGALPTGERRRLLLPHGTSLQSKASLQKKLLSSWDVTSLHTNHLCAISMNPTSVTGAFVPAHELETALRSAFPNVPVWNPFS